MTTQLSIMIGLAIIAAVTADITLNNADALLFLGRKFFVLLDWVAFWR